MSSQFCRFKVYDICMQSFFDFFLESNFYTDRRCRRMHPVYGDEIKSDDMPNGDEGFIKSSDGKNVVCIRCYVGSSRAKWLNTVNADHIMYCVNNNYRTKQLVNDMINSKKTVLVYVIKGGVNYKYGFVVFTEETDTNEKGQSRVKLLRQSRDTKRENDAACTISKKPRISTECFYNGKRYLSRLEAKHAKLMDAMKVRFKHEMQKVTIADNEEYTPDYYLPKLNAFLEIKPDEPPLDARLKCRQACENSGIDVYLFYKSQFIPADTESGRDYTHASGIRAMRWWQDDEEVVHFDDSKYLWVFEDMRGFYIDKQHHDHDMRYKHPRLLEIYNVFNDDGIENA